MKNIKFSFLRILTIMLLLIWAAGCKSQSHVNGQIFIVTDNKINENMKGEHVYIYPLKEIQEQISQKLSDPKNKPTTVAGYLQGVPAAEWETDTDDDGKFTLNIPAGDYAVYSVGDRQTPVDSEHYTWLVKMKVSGDITSLSLTNRNLTTAKNTTESLLSGVQ